MARRKTKAANEARQKVISLSSGFCFEIQTHNKETKTRSSPWPSLSRGRFFTVQSDHRKMLRRRNPCKQKDWYVPEMRYQYHGTVLGWGSFVCTSTSSRLRTNNNLFTSSAPLIEKKLNGGPKNEPLTLFYVFSFPFLCSLIIGIIITKSPQCTHRVIPISIDPRFIKVSSFTFIINFNINSPPPFLSANKQISRSQ